MSETLDCRTLWRGSSVAISDVCCRSSRVAAGVDELTASYDLVFPRHGLFVRHFEGREDVADANAVLFLNRGEVHRVTHPAGGGDECTVFSFDRRTAIEAARAWDHPDRPFRRSWATAGRGLHAFAERLRRYVRAGAPDGLAIREGAFRVLEVALGAKGAGCEPRDLERVHGVKVVLARQLTQGVSLERLAREVACSPFHLSRIFRRATGVPIHRYLNRLRLRVALTRLGDAPRLTELALDLGFSSHGHFTDAFRRELGVPPSAWRNPPSTASLREMSKILEV